MSKIVSSFDKTLLNCIADEFQRFMVLKLKGLNSIHVPFANFFVLFRATSECLKMFCF